MAEKDQLLKHNYDGIKEYDNDLPRWWIQLFWVTAIAGVVYALWFHLIWGTTPQNVLAGEMQNLADLRANGVAVTASLAPELTDDSIRGLIQDAAVISKGQAVFTARCLPCHGAQGGGIVGPNLTDEFWIHGGNPLAIRKTIVDGVPAKGMLAWGTTLPSEDIDAVTAYVLSLQGSNPPGAKAPEGEKIAAVE